MAHTKTNLKNDVDDIAPQFGLEGSIEARFGRTPLGCEKLGVTYMSFAPGFRPPFAHKHREQEEVYVVVSGGGRAKVEDEIVDLEQWDALKVPGPAVRSFEAGPEGLEMIIVGAPVFAESDGEMINDWWTD